MKYCRGSKLALILLPNNWNQSFLVKMFRGKACRLLRPKTLASANFQNSSFRDRFPETKSVTFSMKCNSLLKVCLHLLNL
jgi:hypothetical protein